MEQQQFQENVSEWIIITNARLSQIQEDIADISIVQEEDLMTLSYQYKLIKDLRKRVIELERKLYEMTRMGTIK